MTAYFTAGGLLTSAWVNALQLVVELVVFAALAAARALAPPAAGRRRRRGARRQTPSTGASGRAARPASTYLALLVPAFIVSPGLLQKVYGARDDRTVRLGVGLQRGGCCSLFAFVPALLGMIARALHPDLPHHELALPTLLLRDLPPILGALGLAAVFSTEVNTADAILFMLSTSLSQDLYSGYVNPAGHRRRRCCGRALGGGGRGHPRAWRWPWSRRP